MDSAIAAHDPAAEAAEVVGDDYDVRVLEPSPPAVAEGPSWADDPADPAPTGARPVVAPHSGGDLTWDDLIVQRPGLADFAADRWLGARRQLPVVPSDYPSALFDFHRLALSPSWRRPATSATASSGFATPAAASAPRSSATTRRCGWSATGW